MAPKSSEYLKIAHQRAVEKKTHVSFPQLKYPSLRDGGLKDPVQWLTGKALDDGAEGLWRVHNGLYYLSDFIKKHPGGEEWLELTKGTDITEAFEAHHLSKSVWKMLEKYYKRDAKTPRNSPFTFEEDGFYRSLKRDVIEELKKIPKDIPKRADRIIDGLLVTLLLSSAISVWAKNFYVVAAAVTVASVTLAWVIVAAHNYIHRKTNWRMYLFNLGLWSYRDFRVSHALSHHLYPNTLMDLEVSAFEPLVFWNPRKDVPITAYLAFCIELVTFPFIFHLNFVKRLISNFVRKGFFTQHYRWHDGLAFLLPLWMAMVTGSSLYDAFKMWLLITCGGSFVFFTIGSNAAHHHPKLFKDGDQVREETVDWGVFELMAVMDRKDINGNLFKVMTFFGDHALHHLFPTLDHAVLPYLYPALLKHCKDFKAKYHISNQWDLFVGQIIQTLKTEPNVLEDWNFI